MIVTWELHFSYLKNEEILDGLISLIHEITWKDHIQPCTWLLHYDVHNLSLTTTEASAVKESYEEFGLSITWTLNLNGSWLWSTLLKVFVVVIIPDVWSILKKLLFGSMLYDNWPYLPLSSSSACKHWYRKHKLGEGNNIIHLSLKLFMY